jgi:hypothetical protein
MDKLISRFGKAFGKAPRWEHTVSTRAVSVRADLEEKLR